MLKQPYIIGESNDGLKIYAMADFLDYLNKHEQETNAQIKKLKEEIRQLKLRQTRTENKL